MNKVYIFISVFIYSFGCLGQTKARVVPANIDTLIAFENSLKPNYDKQAPTGAAWFNYLPGKRRVLITAPHATAQTREGKVKIADGGTGSLAYELHKISDVPTLYTTYLSPYDPNYYDNNAFKDSLGKILDRLHPILVIDLHASAPYRPYDIDLGTLNGKSISGQMQEKIIAILKDEGINNLSLNYFAAEKNQTDTKFSYNKKIPCVQLEINANFLSADASRESNIYCQKTAQLLDALVKLIDVIDPPSDSEKK
jgi:hypothetical protein